MEFAPLIDFIKSLYPGKNPIVLHEPQFIGNEKNYVNDCIDNTYVSSVGKYVAMFEERMAEFLSERAPDLRRNNSILSKPQPSIYCVAAVNGTAALHLALQVIGVKPGDRVITQPLTFIATANAILYAGADPVFVDVDRDTLGMSPLALEEYLIKTVKRQASRVTAILPMHTFGHPCRIDEIVEIGNKYGIPVIEDAAESIGSYYKGNHTGTYGVMGVLSFNGNKTITTGGGGMIITRDPVRAKRLKHLTTQAKVPHAWEFKHDETGYNYRMPNINAALGVAQLEMLLGDQRQENGRMLELANRGMGFLEAKRLLANRYKEFCYNNNVEFVKEPEHSSSNYWLNAILLSDLSERNEFLQYAYDHGVHCRPAWELMHRLPMFTGNEHGNLSNAEWIADRLVNLPSSPIL
jgi:aminotransferase in exopolysaccharide biosynthesis